MGTKEAKRASELPPETSVYCGTGKDAYRVIIEFPMAKSDLREVIHKRTHPDLKGKEGEALVAAIVKGLLENVTHVMISRFKNGLLNDGPKGEPGHQIFNEQHRLVLEEHFKDAKLHDGINGAAAFQVFDEKERLERATHFKNGVATAMKHFSYTDAVMKEEDTSLDARLKRIFSKAAAPKPKEWKVCNVTVEYRTPDRLPTDGPNGEPGHQSWQIGYEAPQGVSLRQTFSRSAKLISSQRYKDGKIWKEPWPIVKHLLRKPWPAAR